MTGADPGLTLRSADQPPVSSAAIMKAPPIAPSKTWRQLMTPNETALPQRLAGAVASLAADRTVGETRRMLVEDYDITALEQTVAGTEPRYEYAYAAANLLRGSSDSRFWDALRLTRQLGSGMTSLEIRSSLDDIADGPLRIFNAVDDVQTIVLGLPEGFREAKSNQRRAWLQFVVEDLASVFDIRLVTSTLEQTWLADRHHRDLPAGVIEAAHPRLRETAAERAEESAQAALDSFGLENPHYDVLRVLKDTGAQDAAFRELYSDQRIPVADTTVRKRLERLEAADLVHRYGSDAARRVSLLPGGERLLEDLDAIQATLEPDDDIATDAADGPVVDEPASCASCGGVRPAAGTDSVDATGPSSTPAQGGMQNQNPDVSAPVAAMLSKYATPPCDCPPDSLRRCRVIPRARSERGRGSATAAGRASTAKLSAPSVEWLSPGEHHATAAAADAADIALSDRPVAGRTNPYDVSISYNASRDELVTSVEWDGPLSALVRLCVALTSDKLWNRVLTADRLDPEGEAFAGLVEDNPYILRRTRCLGYLKDADANRDGYRRAIQNARFDLLELAGEVRGPDGDYDEDLASDVMRDAHGIIGTMTELLDLAGVDLVREITLPEYSRNIHAFRHTLLKFLSRAIPIGARKGHYSAYRVLFESRTEKREDLLSAPDIDEPVGDIIGSWVLSGPGIRRLLPELPAGIERHLELQEDGKNFAPFRLDIDVADADRRAVVDEVAERVLEAKHLESTDEVTAALHTFCDDPLTVAEALIRLGGEQAYNERPVELRDLRYGLSALDPEDLLWEFGREVGHSIPAIVHALLRVDEPISQRQLASLAEVTPATVREHTELLSAAGLIETSTGGPGHATHYRLRLPFDDKRDPTERSAVATPAFLEGEEAAAGLPWTADTAVDAFLRDVTGTGIVSRDGELWSALRAAEDDVSAVPDLEGLGWTMPWVELLARLAGDQTGRAPPSARRVPEEMSLGTTPPRIQASLDSAGRDGFAAASGGASS